MTLDLFVRHLEQKKKSDKVTVKVHQLYVALLHSTHCTVIAVSLHRVPKR